MPDIEAAEELARWRGNMEARMGGFESTITDIRIDLRELRKTTGENNIMLLSLVKKNGNGSPQSSAITFKWVIEKLLLPLMLGVNAILLALFLEHLAGS